MVRPRFTSLYYAGRGKTMYRSCKEWQDRSIKSIRLLDNELWVKNIQVNKGVSGD